MEDQVLSLIQNSGLTHIADDITSLLRSTISIKMLPVGEAELPLGISKIGGLPDLPPEIDWPEWDNQPLPLIAQIRLADIVPYDRFGELPHTGMLYFFFNEETLDTYPPALGSWHVLHYDGDIAHLRRMLASSDEQLIYPSCAMTFSPTLTLPPLESLYLERLGLSYDAYRHDAPFEQRREVDAYVRLTEQLETFYESVPPYHQFLGYPCQIQGDLLLECQRDTHSKGDPADWRLLLQVGSDDNVHMMWGDVGMLYFYIPQEALTMRDFSQVHLIMQCS
jgi:uncharacterized protein YwqG